MCSASAPMRQNRSSSWHSTSRRCRRASWRCGSPTDPQLFRLRGFGLPPAEGARPDRQSGLYRDQGGRCVQGQDHRPNQLWQTDFVNASFDVATRVKATPSSLDSPLKRWIRRFGSALAELWRQVRSQCPATPQLRAPSSSDAPLEGDGLEPTVPCQIGEAEKVERDNATGCCV